MYALWRMAYGELDMCMCTVRARGGVCTCSGETRRWRSCSCVLRLGVSSAGFVGFLESSRMFCWERSSGELAERVFARMLGCLVVLSVLMAGQANVLFAMATRA